MTSDDVENLESKLTAAQAEINEYHSALQALWSDVGGGKKFCGHTFSCTCAGDMVRELLKKKGG